MSAFSTILRSGNEEGATGVAVSPHTLHRPLQHEILAANLRWLGDLQADLAALLIDQVDGHISMLELLDLLSLVLLWRVARAFAATLVLALGAGLI